MIERPYLVLRTATGTLIVARRSSDGADHLIVRSRTGDSGTQEDTLRGIVASIEKDARGEYRPIPGTEGAPKVGLRLVLGSDVSGFHITSKATFVGVLREERRWVVPHLIRANREGVSMVHALVQPLAFETEALGRGAAFYERFCAWASAAVPSLVNRGCFTERSEAWATQSALNI